MRLISLIRRIFSGIVTSIRAVGVKLARLLRWLVAVPQKLVLHLIWEPLLLLVALVQLSYRKVLRPPFALVFRGLRAAWRWLYDVPLGGTFRWLGKVLRAIWAGVRLRLYRWSPSGRSALRQRMQTIEHSSGTVVTRRYIAEPQRISKRGGITITFNPVTTVVISTGILIALGFFSTQMNLRDGVVAIDLVETPVDAPGAVTVTGSARDAGPTRTPPPTPTATAIPTAALPDIVFETPPDPLEDGGTIAFTMRRNGNDDIYALSIGLDEPVRLTGSEYEDRDPAWSPDGNKLAFASRRNGNWDIFILNMLSGEVNPVTDDPAFEAAPSWSPDGMWLVYESYRDGNLDLYLASANEELLPIRLTEHPAHDYSPVWSPDGRHIAFTSWRSGSQDIYIMSLDNPADDQAINVTMSAERQEDHPAFNYDASMLAYEEKGAGFEMIYVMPLEKFRPAAEPYSVAQGTHPSWSPDGDSLVLVHNNGSQNFLVASSVSAWNIAPQAFASESLLDDASWSSLSMPRAVAQQFEEQSPQEEVPLFEEELSEPKETGAPYLVWEVAIDAPAPYLSDRVNQSFTALRERVIVEAGWDFLGVIDNMFMPLSSSPLPGESSRSWSKAGRAFDFYYRYPISVDPQVEVVREDLGNQTFWRVYLRAALQDGAQGEPLRQLPWDFGARYDSDPRYYDQGGKLKDTIPAGFYVDFTALASDYGWERVPALESWRTYFQGIRYWRFVNSQGLTWNEAIRELYTPEELALVYGES